jgi:cbb3-type cytochrome oxidase maturation protein
MDVIYGLIPMMLFFGFLVVVVFIWMAKSGHFDDMDGAANRIFMEDDYPDTPQASESTCEPREAKSEKAEHPPAEAADSKHIEK